MSRKIECPGCAMEVDAASAICPFCQYEFPQARQSFKWVGWLMLILLIYPVLLILNKILSMF